VEYLQASLLTAGGIVLIASVALAKRVTPAQLNSLLPVQGFLAIALFVTGGMWLVKGPLRILQGPPLLVVVVAGISYGAVAAGACLAFPKQTPKPLQVLVGAFSVVAGTLFLLLQLRVIKPI
jgi:hypothetical protein